MADTLTGVERILQQVHGGRLPRQLFVLAGPSGVGKNTIIKRILTNHPHQMARVHTYTTRPPRPDEVPGEQYHFVSPATFRDLALAGHLMEADAITAGHDVYGEGHLYSMPADIFTEIAPECHLVIAEVDIPGTRRLKARYPDCITIFLTAPPLVLLDRIRERAGSATQVDDLDKRMETAREQFHAAKEFDYIVFNDTGQLDDTVAAIETIILAERMRVRPGVDLEAALPENAFHAAP
jgi:guanylate kinase